MRLLLPVDPSWAFYRWVAEPARTKGKKNVEKAHLSLAKHAYNVDNRDIVQTSSRRLPSKNGSQDLEGRPEGIAEG
jgi:hypothetical protein